MIRRRSPLDPHGALPYDQYIYSFANYTTRWATAAERKRVLAEVASSYGIGPGAETVENAA